MGRSIDDGMKNIHISTRYSCCKLSCHQHSWEVGQLLLLLLSVVVTSRLLRAFYYYYYYYYSNYQECKNEVPPRVNIRLLLLQASPHCAAAKLSIDRNSIYAPRQQKKSRSHRTMRNIIPGSTAAAAAAAALVAVVVCGNIRLCRFC